MNTGTPVVAMTANVMVSELEKYKKHGMPDCLGKPFTSQELWHILLKHLTPIRTEPVNGSIGDNEELQKKLRFNFFNSNQAVHDEIKKAATAGDTKLAHRLAHSLKGNAGLIGKTALRNAASEVEMLLKDGIDSVWENKMKLLETELNIVMDELKQQIDEPELHENHRVLSRNETLELFEKLTLMLKDDNTDCIDLIEDIRSIPAVDEKTKQLVMQLAQQIDDFELKAGAKTLVELIKEME
jgi:HPt (histidine-containing phosphotransfer) domain-containing protein